MSLQLFDGDGRPTAEASRHARDVGMAQALDHAEADDPDFSDKATHYLYTYALTHDRFTGFMVTTSARITKSVKFKSGKAWGSLFVRAQREGWIVKDGFTTDAARHMNPCPVYKSLIYREAA